MTPAEIWSVVSSVVSVILAVFAMGLSIYFFVETKNTEQRVTNSLSKIEAQAEGLQKLNAKWMDRLTRYVTEDRPQPTDAAVPQLIQVLAQLPATLTATITQHPDRDTQARLVDEIHTAYIAMYFYIAQTNYWSQFYLPGAAEFDENDEFHKLVKRVVDMSEADFSHIAGILGKCDPERLYRNPLAHLLTETKDTWRNRVRSTAEVFVARERSRSA
jgi:hypothetical protein